MSGILRDYSRQAETYDATRAASPSVLAPLREALAGAPGRVLVDVGGGTGNYAAALAKDGWEPLVACLAREDRAARQVGASRRTRRREGRLQIALRAGPPTRALLLDDVHTTGATLEACAAVLRAGGCRDVAAVTYARTL